MERNLKPTGLVNFLIALAAAGLGGYIARQTASYTDEVVSVFLGLGFLVALFSYFQMRMEARERLEKLELDELAKSARNTTLFEGTDAEAFPARRAREQFEKWLVPAFCILLLVLQAGAAYWLGKQVVNPEARSATASLPMMAAFFGFLFFLQFLPGRYSVNVARLEGQRLLQPAGSYLLLGAYLSLIAAGGNVAIYFGHSKIDLLLSRALCAILALAAVENLLTLILEIYRPRVRGQAARVLYESRLVGLWASRRAFSPRRRTRWTTSSASRFRRRGSTSSCKRPSSGCCSFKPGCCGFRPVLCSSSRRSRRCWNAAANRWATPR